MFISIVRFLTLFFVIGLASTAYAQTNTISGTVSLPAGMSAPAGGYGIQISVRETPDIGGQQEQVFVTIPAGANASNYALQVPSDPGKLWIVQYFCGLACGELARFGYHATAGTAPNAILATPIASGADATGINMELLPTISISGTVSLPAGELAPAGGIDILLLIRGAGGSFYDEFDTVVQIPEGAAQQTYSVNVAQDDRESWTIDYACMSNCDPYFDVGGYSDSGIAFNPEDDTLLSGGAEHLGIDLTIPHANFISGSITLPNNDTAPAGGVQGSVLPELQNNTGSSFFGISGFFDIMEGESTATYTAKIPPANTGSWVVYYNCYSPGCSNTPSEGFYSLSGTTISSSDATALPEAQDSSNIDIELLPAVTIGGTITLPNGIILDGDNLSIDVYAYDRNRPLLDGGYAITGRQFLSPSGEFSSFNYAVSALDDPNADIVIGIGCFSFLIDNIDTCSNILGETYIGSSGVSYNIDAVTGIIGGTEISDANGELIEADSITGSVSLPLGATASDFVGTTVLIDQAGDPFDFSTQTRAFIVRGASSMDYSLRVPKGLSPNNWILRVECDSNCDGYEFQSYYNAGASTSIQQQATQLANTQGYSGIDIPLVVSTPMTAFTCDALVDDFSGTTLDLAKIGLPGFSGALANGGVEIEQSLISQQDLSTFGPSRRFNLDLPVFPDLISADVTLNSSDLTDSDTGLVFASTRGSFYYTITNPADYDDNLGEVFASISIGDRGNGLEAWYEILESTDPFFESFITHTDEVLIPPGTLELNMSHTMKLSFNPANREFTFGIDGTSASAIGPVAGTSAVPVSGLFRGFTAGAVPVTNTDSDEISVAAFFDNVFIDEDISDDIDAVLYDDFSGVSLDPAKWEQAERSRNLTGGKMLTSIKSVNADTRSVRSIIRDEKYQNAECIQGDLSLKSTSVALDGTRIRNRINGYFFNAEYDGSQGYNGFDGTVYAQIALEKTEGGTFRAAVYAEQVTDAGYNNTQELAFSTFITPAEFDEEYTAAIKLDIENKQLLFQFEDEIFSLPILTNIYAANPQENFTGFTTRVQSGPGEVEATVDNVYATESTLVPASAPQTDDALCFPIASPNGAAIICL